MNKAILAAAAMAGLSLSSHAQGILFQDGSARSYDTTINGVPNTTQNLNLELLLGTSSGDMNVDVVTLLLSSSAEPSGSGLTPFGGVYSATGDITATPGLIFDHSDLSYDASAYADETVYLQVLAWTGNYDSYNAAINASAHDTTVAVGACLIFSSTVPSTPASFPADISGVGVINVVTIDDVPEPGTMALAGLGGLALLFFRRKK